ncbi:MAG: YqaJ viral recombinase family protein [Spirochaetales bacterium]|nr:YqaJ viral recombinase family protein [Spirochaetales bacterium]
MVEHKVEQRSAEWFALRCGRITGSRFKDLMSTDKSKLKGTKGQLSLLREVAAERLTGMWEESSLSKAMQWGIDKEDEARRYYSDYLMADIRESGFWEFSEGAGCSPDGIILSERALEIKCPATKTHLLYYMDNSELWKEYRWQAVGHALCTGLGDVDLISYDPRLPDDKKLVVYRPGDISKDILLLKERLIEAEEVIRGIVA